MIQLWQRKNFYNSESLCSYIIKCPFIRSTATKEAQIDVFLFKDEFFVSLSSQFWISSVERLLFFSPPCYKLLKWKLLLGFFYIIYQVSNKLYLILFLTRDQETYLEWALSIQESDFVFLLHMHIHIIWMASHSLHTTTLSCLRNYFCLEIISSWLTQTIKTSYNISHHIHIFILTRIKKSL